ncbi:MAG: fumarate hydratase [Candidatus Cloacimonetes bacterium 4572_55]|nr:MAG: fumarate hydratase [Candidatus Cloacimonetes bacterium 4572_55]
MNKKLFTENILELIRRTSAYLPHDAELVINKRKAAEEKGSRAEFAMQMVCQNIGLAKERSLPICQDTGTISFYVETPVCVNQNEIKELLKDAAVLATEKGYLRQNSVDSLTGENSGNNLGPGSPSFYFSQCDGDEVTVRLVLKGGGCENVGAQYPLPAVIGGKKQGRDLEGVYACIMDAVHQAQGKGCGPGFLGVCVGGDRASGLAWAKRQLLRPLDDVNPIPALEKLEGQIMTDANKLGIGPMGFGGKFTLGGCKIGSKNRVPASFYVSVAYMCWAFRRRGVQLDSEGNVARWLYQKPDEFDRTFEAPEEMQFDPEESKVLQMPLSESDVRGLKVGDRVMLNGKMFTGRDAVHKYLFEGGELDVIKDGVIYHCGPVVVENDGAYQVMAAGPTTSIREEPYQGELIKKFGLKAVIGKGGMGDKTRKACQEHGAVYLHAIGGAAQFYAKCIIAVDNVYLKQFGSPEAVWELRVENFPAVVTIDAHGNSIHAEVQKTSDQNFMDILGSKNQ